MKDLSDNEFDRIFKEKSQNFDYQFEEEAWLLMEKKLQKRDRVIYFRNFSIAALLLLFLATGLYLFNQQTNQNPIVQKANRKHQDNLTAKQHTHSSNTSNLTGNKEGNSLEKNLTKEKLYATAKNKVANKNSKHVEKSLFTERLTSEGSLPITHLKQLADSLDRLNSVAIAFNNSLVPFDSLNVAKADLHASNSKLSKNKSFKPLFSFTFSAGPDFSSTTSLAGKRGNLNLGLLFNTSYKKFTISAGARYGVKKYDAQALDYALRNPSRAKDIYNIDASCNVLEIPVQLSVTAKSWKNNKIDINAGLSSYLMLKEKYLFEYTAESGINDFMLEKTNANQSYFGVASISATYKFKPTNQNIRFGIEPYAKLPLGGVGEGKVKLKSSGVALTMTYGITKKH